jgi:ABC-type Na+ efflux pump permease subunit
LRYGFILAGLAGAIVLVVMYSSYATKPLKYITPNSYDPVNHTIYIYGETTYGVPENFTAITLNGESATMDAFRGYYEMKSVTTALNKRNNTKEITSIILATVPRKLDEKLLRQFLLGMTILEFAVILLIVTNAAASTVTREKEDGSLDLLLTTPITSRYYIWGKLRGLVSFVIPLLAVPVVSAGIFVAYDCIRLLGGAEQDFKWIVLPEALIVLPGTLVIVAAFASILGMQMSLRCRTTVRAVMSSVGIMLGACGALGWCGYQFLSGTRGGGDSQFMIILSSFSPFTVLMLMIDPWDTAGRAFTLASPADVVSNRVLIFIVSWIAIGAYALAVWTMYKSMVKNFDMTIRRQSR